MPKPAVFIDLASGDYFQFAAGREDTLQIQHLNALSPAAAVNLYVGSTGLVTLGGPASTTSVLGSSVLIDAAVGQDLTFGARGVSLTLNQLGQENLVGFAPGVTSLVAAINDVKSAVGLAGLQGAYDTVNTIAMTTGRNLVFYVFDGAGPADFILQTVAARTFLRTDGLGQTVQLGDGTNITSVLSGYIKSDLNFDPGTQYRYVQRTGTANGTPASPDAIYVKGLINGTSTAGADVYLVAERNAAGPGYGGQVWLASYLGAEGVGTLQTELELSSSGARVQAHAGAVQVTSGATWDVSLSARGGSITVNEIGNINLVGFTAVSVVGALNELKAGMNLETLQQAYAAGNTISMTTARPLTFTTFDGVGPSDLVVRNSLAQTFLQTDTTNDLLRLGSTTDLKVSVSGRLVSDLRFDEADSTNRVVWLSGSSTAERTLTVIADKDPGNVHGANLQLTAVKSAGAGGDGGDLVLTSFDDTLPRSSIQLHPTGDAVAWGLYVESYGRAAIAVDPASPVGSPLSITNSIGPTTVDATGGTFTVNATGQSVTLDCQSIDMDATAASHLTSTATLLLGAANDLTFGGRGATITLNQLGEENLSPGFTATSIVGALNELYGGGGGGNNLQNAYNLGNVILMSPARSVLFQTNAGSDFVVQNAALPSRVFLRSNDALGTVDIGDPLLTDVMFSSRGVSLTFNQVSDPALVGFAPATTSIVAALNELKASPSGGVTATYTTAEAVVLGDALYTTAAGTVGVADYTTVAGKDMVVGFATQSVGPGFPCVVALAGEVTVKSTLAGADVGKSAYLDVTGNVSVTAPILSGFTLTRVGVITASGALTSKIAVQVAAPITL